jgi:RNA polymerase sigma-70 factor (ECF subfamily)
MEDSRGLSIYSDEQLMSLARSGNQHAFATVFERHRTLVRAIASRVAGAAQSEDVAQVAYLAAWQGVPRYDEERGSPRVWLLTIVRHRAIDALRRDRSGRRQAEAHTIARGEQRLQDVHGHADITIIEREGARHLRAALEVLPGAQRRVLELAYFDGLSHTEIAERIGIPLGTVKGRLRLGLTKLEGHLAAGPDA